MLKTISFVLQVMKNVEFEIRAHANNIAGQMALLIERKDNSLEVLASIPSVLDLVPMSNLIYSIYLIIILG